MKTFTLSPWRMIFQFNGINYFKDKKRAYLNMPFLLDRIEINQINDQRKTFSSVRIYCHPHPWSLVALSITHADVQLS